MKRLVWLVVAALLLLPAATMPAAGAARQDQEAVIEKIIELGRTDNQVMQHLDVVCNLFGGRYTGSNAYTNACNWAVQELRSWGLKAELDYVGEVAVGFNRGPWFGKMTKPKEMDLTFGTPTFTAGTKGVQRGHVVVMPENDEEFEEMKDKIESAWVLISGDNSGWARDRRGQSPLVQKIQEAGALGTIQKAASPIRLLYGRVNSWEELPQLPDIKLHDEHYDQIMELLADDQEVELEFDIRNNFRPGPIAYHNVVAWIPGTEFPDEYVIMGGHFDAFDGATGAIDNGSGFTVAMEAARLIMAAGGKPKRSIMVHLWAAEEAGLVGSGAWVRNHPHELSSISAVFNRDGGTNAAVSLSVTPSMKADFEKICAPLFDLNPDYPFELRERAEMRGGRGGGSDGASFSRAGIPSLSFGTKGDHVYRTTWHTVLDTYDQVVPEYQEHTAIATAITVYGVANLDHLLSREEVFPYDPSRDQGQRRRGPSEVERIIEIGRTDNQVMRHLDVLCNSIGSRLSGSDGYVNACLWAKAEFEKWGLEVELDKATEMPVGFNRGPWFGKIVEPAANAKNLKFGTNAWSAGTKGVQRGPAVLAPKTLAEFAELEDKLNGAWVLTEGGGRGRRGQRGQQQDPAAAQAAQELREGIEQAGILGYIRSSGARITTSGRSPASWAEIPTIPQINMLGDHFNEIKELVDAGEEVVLEFDIRNHFIPGPVPIYNVIATIPGTTYPDEYVIFGGHIDCWDGATGAVDNGSGVSTAMEAARILMAAGVQPKRNLVFFLFGAEEQGLIGSSSWVRRNPDKLPYISGVFVHDSGTNVISGVTGTPAMQEDLEKVFAPVIGLNEEYPFTINIREPSGRGGGGGSDHASFTRQGVPGFFWRLSGRHVYNTTWHTHLDTYDQVIAEYQEHSAIIVALTAYGLGNLDHLLSREGLQAPGGGRGR